MKYAVTGIFDEGVRYFIEVSHFRSRQEARRVFERRVNDRDDYLYRHPDQYTFFYFGEFDDETGVFELEEKPIWVDTGDYVAAPNEVRLPRRIREGRVTNLRTKEERAAEVARAEDIKRAKRAT